MAKKTIKDTDYLSISARVRAMENDLLTEEQFEQLIAARTDEDVAKLLQSFGYGELETRRPEALDAGLSAMRAAMLEDLAGGIPNAGDLDVFKIKYDYHNVKAMLKAEAMGIAPGGMLSDLGRVKPEELQEAQRGEDGGGLPGLLGEAAKEGREILDATRDPQLSDAALDKWYFRDLAAAAEQTGSGFLCGYVSLQTDAANLRTLVRTLRMGKNEDFLRGVLFDGGSVSHEDLLRISAAKGGGLTELFALTPLERAAEAGAKALQGGALTEFEKRCDDALSGYLERSRLIPFGEAPVLAYFAALETEYTNLRIILMGRMAGVPADVIRSRLRAGAV